MPSVPDAAIQRLAERARPGHVRRTHEAIESRSGPKASPNEGSAPEANFFSRRELD